MKRITLRKRDGSVKYAIVDNKDFEELNSHKWSHAVFNEKRGSGRREVVMRTEKGKSIYMAIEIMKAPKGMKVDHKNKNPLDNRRTNLRICTNSQNLMNRGKTKVNKTGYKGVSKAGNKFRAQITTNRKSEYIGTYSTAREAAHAFDERALARDPKFSLLNFA